MGCGYDTTPSRRCRAGHPAGRFALSTFVLRRLWQMGLTLQLVSILVFLVIHLIPGSPAEVIAGPDSTPEQLAALNERYGLDRPLPVQYVYWLGNVLRGEFGTSYINGYPVAKMVLQRIPATLELASAGLLVGVLIAFPLGLLAATRPHGFWDVLATVFAAVGFAMPGYFLLILLILLFSLHWPYLPPSGRPDLLETPGLHLRSLVMPALTLGVGVAVTLVRYLRASLVEVLSQDYVRHAHARGIGRMRILARHALPNALIPVLTVMGIQLGELLSGAIIIESIYAWPGIGRLTVQAIELRDYMVLQATILLIVLGYLLSSLLTDLAYGWVDPRIRTARHPNGVQ